VAAGSSLSQKSFAQVQSVIRHHMEKHPATAMLQQAKGMLKQKAPSSAIFGILKGMKETFETNLAQAKTDEEEAIAQFIAVKEAKTREVKAAEDLIDTKTVEMAEAKEINAHGKEDLADSRAQLSADNEFLSNLNLKCDNADKEYNDRVKVRNEETVAVAETIAILNDDDAKDQFNKGGLGTFVQISSHTMRKSQRELAATMLSKAGKELHKPALITLSMGMRLHGFEEVIDNIDKMKAALKAEQAEEVKQKDYCVTEFNANEKNTAEKMSLKGDLEAKINNLGTMIEDLTEAIRVLNEEVAATSKEMTRASQIREQANHEFQVTIADQRATQAILKKAVDRLKSFYAAALVQAGQEPPAQGSYKKNAGASGIMEMIQTLIDESKQLEVDSMKGEADSQAAYESFMNDSTASNKACMKEITNKSASKAKADADSTQAADDLKATITDILTLGDYNQELHKSCDFLVKNFDLRQQSRVQEMEALAQAKAIFQGAK